MRILLAALVVLFSAHPVFAAENGRTTGTISQLIAAGQDVACDFEKNDASGSETGTIYIGQNKMRGDFNVTDPTTGTFVMHMIHDGEYSYNWGGPFGENQGMKMKTGGSPGGHGQGPDLEEEMQFECRPWSVDPNLLTVPSNVEFMDMGGMMPQAAGQSSGTPDMTQLQCMACDEAPEGPERDQCRQELGCP